MLVRSGVHLASHIRRKQGRGRECKNRFEKFDFQGFRLVSFQMSGMVSLVNLFFEYSGAIFWIQVALGFVGLLVVVERMLFFQHTKVNTVDLLLGISNHVRKRAFAEALHEADRVKGPVPRIIHAVLLRHHLDRTNLREISQEAGQLEVPRIERNMRTLLGVAMLAPLVGMLGTVLGLMEAYMDIDHAEGAVVQTALASGMYRSLLSTAMGLAIAIPAYMIYLYLLAKGNRLLRRLERAGIETVNLVCDAREQDHVLSFREEAEVLEREQRKQQGQKAEDPKKPKGKK